MIVAAIDPSLISAGHAIITDRKLVAYGHQPLREHHQISALVDVLASYRPDLTAIEAGFISINAKTGIQLAELRGALTHALQSRGLTVAQIQPSAWRKTTIRPPARSKRKALKDLAVAYVLQHYGLRVTEDEADAICLADHAYTGFGPDQNRAPT